MTKLDFIGIGAEKSGTSWLAKMLSQHPQIFIPPEKELQFFNREYMHNPEVENANYYYNLDWYHNHFSSAKKNQIKGEFSPTYLWSRTAPKKIFEYNSDIKLIVILRNPVEKLFSLYLFYQQIGVLQNISFRKTLKKRPDLLTRGLYYQQLKKYYDLFPYNQIKVLLFNDLLTNKTDLLHRVEEFLGVEEFVPNNVGEKINPTKTSKLPFLNYTIEQTRRFLREKKAFDILHIIRKVQFDNFAKLLLRKNTVCFDQKPKLQSDDRAWLIDYYQKDIKNLEGLIGRNLRVWMRYK